MRSVTARVCAWEPNRRMNKSQQMRWSRRGADLLLQVRCAVFNGTFGSGLVNRPPKFPELLKPPRHPKWKDVNLSARVPGWKQFAPAQEVLGRQLATGQASGTMKADLAAFLARSGVGAHPTDQQLGALVRQFLKEQAQG